MPRIARNVTSDIPYHIIHRGNNRQKIFFCDDDYKYFLSLIKEARKKYRCKLYSYVLMSNHIHLLLESPRVSENLAKYIKLIAQKYAQYINKIHKRTGTLWEGRFKSSPVSKDNYLLACSRYIEMNPVRAGIVKEPKDYKWSSYRYKIGQEKADTLLDLDPLYMSLGKDAIERQKNYQKWFKPDFNSWRKSSVGSKKVLSLHLTFKAVVLTFLLLNFVFFYIFMFSGKIIFGI